MDPLSFGIIHETNSKSLIITFMFPPNYYSIAITMHEPRPYLPDDLP